MFICRVSDADASQDNASSKAKRDQGTLASSLTSAHFQNGSLGRNDRHKGSRAFEIFTSIFVECLVIVHLTVVQRIAPHLPVTDSSPDRVDPAET
jgi:hypothetical protein